MLMLNCKVECLKFLLEYDCSRISAKTGNGKLILSHTEGEPHFFTFGKSEVGNTFPILYFLQIVTHACFFFFPLFQNRMICIMKFFMF